MERQGVNVPPSKIRDALAISDSAGRDCVLFATSFEKVSFFLIFLIFVHA